MQVGTDGCIQSVQVHPNPIRIDPYPWSGFGFVTVTSMLDLIL